MGKYWSDCSQSVSGATRAQHRPSLWLPLKRLISGLISDSALPSPLQQAQVSSELRLAALVPLNVLLNGPWSFLEALPGWHPGRYASSHVFCTHPPPPPSHMSSGSTRLPHWRLSVGLRCWQADTSGSATLGAHAEQQPWKRMNKSLLWRSSPGQSRDVTSTGLFSTWKKISVQGK